MNVPAGLDWIAAELEGLAAGGLRRQRRVVRPLPSGWCELDGRRVLNFAGNDYLNLAQDPRVIAAAAAALREAGAGAGASPLVSGRTAWHAALEERLARFERQPAAILFPSGFAANTGAVAALAGPADTVYCDRLNHASLVDGCRLSGARLRVYRHGDLSRLERALSRQANSGRRLIVTDGVFSMDGDLAPLPELCELARRFGALLLVDEAHATGVYGRHGRGAAEHFGVEQDVAVRVGTLSKALGSLGGFVAGPQPLVDWLWNKARPQIYSTALPASACAAAVAALDIVDAEPERRRRLHERAGELRTALAGRPSTARPTGDGPIVPIVLGAAERTTRAAARLLEAGFLVGAILPPTVPRNASRLRITLCSGHTSDDVARLAEVVSREFSP